MKENIHRYIQCKLYLRWIIYPNMGSLSRGFIDCIFIERKTQRERWTWGRCMWVCKWRELTSRQEVMSNRQLPLFACPSQPTQEFHKYQIINAFSICQRSGQHTIKGDPQTWVWFSFLMSLVLPTQFAWSTSIICLDLLRIPHWLSVKFVEECVCAVRDNYRLWEQSVFSSPPPSPPPAPAPPGKQSISSPTSSTSIPLTQGGPTPPSNSAMVGRCPIFHAYHRTSSFTLYSSPSTLNFERLTLELEAALQRGPHHPANETQAQEFSSRLQYCSNVWYDFAALNQKTCSKTMRWWPNCQ